jgi:hypothetical protein
MAAISNDKCPACGGPMRVVTPKVSMCADGACGKLVQKGATLDVDDPRVGAWVDGRAQEIADQRHIPYARALRLALAEALASLERLEAGDEHESARTPGAAAPKRPLPKLVGKATAIAKAEELVRDSAGDATVAESFAKIHRRAALELWDAAVAKAQLTFGYLDPDAALARWIVTKEGREAYEQIDRHLMHEVTN